MRMQPQVCRTFNIIIKDTLALQYIVSLAACGMQDDLSMTLCQGTAERLQRLREHEAAWREIAWSDGGVIKHMAACDFPTAISGSVLAFLKQYNGVPGNSEVGDRLFLLRIPSKLRGIPGESWELKGLGEMSNLCIDAAQDLLLFCRYVTVYPRVICDAEGSNIGMATFMSARYRPGKSILVFFIPARLIWAWVLPMWPEHLSSAATTWPLLFTSKPGHRLRLSSKGQSLFGIGERETRW